MNKVIKEIAAERLRQTEREGWSVEHDDEHTDGSLAAAAACYALPKRETRRTSRSEVEDVAMRGEGPVYAVVKRAYRIPTIWPKSWHPTWWKPKDRRRDLVRAAALIVAEIERLDRATSREDRLAMAKYRKKPVVIEATQWFNHGDHPAVTRNPASSDPEKGWVPTLEGGHVVTPGDWIITGVKGEFYPCKPEIFYATYEPVQ